MKVYNTPFLFILTLATLFTLASCQDDEVLDLETFPVNQPVITINGTEGASKAELNAIYKSDGTLELDGVVSRTYTFNFLASPEDATVTFDVLSTNIPKENIEISSTKAIIPAGATTASVTVTLKDEDFSFAASNYDAVTYELGVKANVEGYKIGTEAIESKVVIKKEAYIASCSIVGSNGNTTLFERAYSNNQIMNPDPISYTFKVELDKPARKDIRINLTTTGLEDKFMKDITVTPAEIIIPAGELSSEDITWGVTDDFLLQTAEEEFYVLKVIASVESEDPVAQINEKKNILIFNVNKVLTNIGLLPDKIASWTSLSKSGWSATASSGNGQILIDGSGGDEGSDIYTSNDNFWFIVDMQTEKTLNGLGVDYYYNYDGLSAPRNATISTSLDNTTWEKQGTKETPQVASHYFQLYEPVHARYVKVELSGKYGNYLDLTEVYMYGSEN